MILALDQGTTSTRGVVLQGNRLRVTYAARHRQILPGQGRVEHDPGEILTHLRAAMLPATAIGLSNQGESCLGWDAATGEPVGPIIVWQDTRTLDALSILHEAGAGPEVLARAGLPLDPYFSAAKLAWIARQPEALRLGV